ncbi:MAG: response regulator transcription factor [Actinomycetota bacterium]
MGLIRILLVDDHPLVRQGLRTFLELEEEFLVVAEAADGEEALRKIPAFRPDVALVDLVMPRMDGEALTRAVNERHPEVRVVVLTSFGDDARVVSCLQAGAVGFLRKDVSPEHLAQAIRAAAEGHAHLQPEIAAALARQVAKPAAPLGPMHQGLTPREMEVLCHIGHGMSNRLIARRLGVSEKTVKTHVSAILAKLQVRDRTQAALWAVREGLVDPTESAS